jgi:hypothetical protein
MLTLALVVFTIKAAIKVDGGNSPFTIESNITLEELRMKVAKMLDVFADNLVLQYRLSGDKVKDGPTNIADQDQFKMFIDTVRPFIIAKPNKDGKPSQRGLRSIVVTFENGDPARKAIELAQGKSGGGKKVRCQLNLICMCIII